MFLYIYTRNIRIFAEKKLNNQDSAWVTGTIFSCM